VTGPFRNNNPFVVILLVFYGLLLRFGSFVVPTGALRSEADGWLYGLLFQWAGTPSLWPSILAALLTLAQALTLNAIADRERLMGRSNHLPGMAHLILCSLFPEWWGLSSAMVANTLLIPVWGILNGLFNNPRQGRLLFNAGLLIGVAALFHKPALWLILLVFAALFTMGVKRTADWLVALFGLAIPFYFLLSWLYLDGRWAEARDLLPRPGLFLPEAGANSYLHFAGMAYMAVLLLYGIWQIQIQIARMLIRSRKVWNILAFYLFLSFAIPYLLAPGDIPSRLLIAPALAVFHASGYLQTKPRWVPEAIHIAGLAIVVWANTRMLAI
jgi:hypothetical protein